MYGLQLPHWSKSQSLPFGDRYVLSRSEYARISFLDHSDPTLMMLSLQTAASDHNIGKTDQLLLPSCHDKLCKPAYKWGETANSMVEINGSCYPPWENRLLESDRGRNSFSRELPEPAPNYLNVVC